MNNLRKSLGNIYSSLTHELIITITQDSEYKHLCEVRESKRFF